jgi:hypothetical protein
MVYTLHPLLTFVLSKKSMVFLTPKNGIDICYIDTPVVIRTYGAETMLGKIQEFMMEKKAWAHWGKINHCITPEYVQSVYPGFQRWKEVTTKLNPQKKFQ